jgi:hypothetical protein
MRVTISVFPSLGRPRKALGVGVSTLWSSISQSSSCHRPEKTYTASGGICRRLIIAEWSGLTVRVSSCCLVRSSAVVLWDLRTTELQGSVAGFLASHWACVMANENYIKREDKRHRISELYLTKKTPGKHHKRWAFCRLQGGIDLVGS